MPMLPNFALWKAQLFLPDCLLAVQSMLGFFLVTFSQCGSSVTVPTPRFSFEIIRSRVSSFSGNHLLLGCKIRCVREISAVGLVSAFRKGPSSLLLFQFAEIPQWLKKQLWFRIHSCWTIMSNSQALLWAGAYIYISQTKRSLPDKRIIFTQS